VSRDERKIIDHRIFQRLRRIKQTAFLNLIFQGATHDRFSHSVGAMHMAGLIFDNLAAEFTQSFGPRALQPAQEDYFRRLIRIAALLHDVGHGPFSHSLEGVSRSGLPLHPKRKELFESGVIPDHWIEGKKSKKTQAWLEEISHHEDFSLAFIAQLGDENEGRIAGFQAQDVASIICPQIGSTDEFLEMDRVGPTGKWNLKKALAEIVSGELDADRMDYLMRDSHYTGVPYGKYDQEMLLENMIWRPHPNKKHTIVTAIRRKALHAFEDFLISRFHMFMQVYSHKTVVAFDVILENALAELADLKINPDLVDYERWSDDWLLRLIIENRSSKWGEFIRDRKPLKHLFTLRQDQQKDFKKFIEKYQCSEGTTAWFPSLHPKEQKEKQEDIPKLWWRKSVSFLTKELRGLFPLFVEEKGHLLPVEEISILLKSDYVRRFDMVHVYCLRGEDECALKWFERNGLSKQILPKKDEI